MSPPYIGIDGGVRVGCIVMIGPLRGPKDVLKALLLGGLGRTPTRRVIVARDLFARGPALLDHVLVGGQVVTRKLEVVVHRHG